MTRVLVIKTGALGDVLRSTSILPGLAQRHDDLHLTWVTAPGARPLVEHHRLVDGVIGLDPVDPQDLARWRAELARQRWERVLSLDDEEPLCRLAAGLPLAPGGVLSGATLDAAGRPGYTDDVAPWFDMGLISRLGKERADQLKLANVRTHPEILASMLGLAPGRPELPLPGEAREFAARFAHRHALAEGRPLIGLNTGAGGRWPSKELGIGTTVELAGRIRSALPEATFLVLGGPQERDRNVAILAGLAAARPALRAIDGGTDNALLDFAALVGLTDVMVASDSLALHLAIALERRIVCFFAPTSAAEIELYGLGVKVESSAPDYCSYRADADNSTITPELLCAKVLEVLEVEGR